MNLSGDQIFLNINRLKLTTVQVVGEGENFSWGGAQTKGKVSECKHTKNMFLHSDLLKFCLKKKPNITEFFPDTTTFYDEKTHVTK